MKIREHRGSLELSMETCREIEPTFDSLWMAVRDALTDWIEVKKDQVKIKPYSYDARIGWDAYIVTVDNWGVFGFTDGPVVDFFDDKKLDIPEDSA